MTAIMRFGGEKNRASRPAAPWERKTGFEPATFSLAILLMRFKAIPA